MYRNRIVTILLVMFSIFSFFFLFSYSEKDVFAQVSCPSNIDPSSPACLNYLRDQQYTLQKQQGALQSKISDEEYQQLSLQDRIAYTNIQIEQTEQSIKILEVEIAAHNVEIDLLKKNIDEKEDSISVLGQEVSILGNTVTKRISESYKYSFVGPLELFLDVKNISTIIRKTKYLVITRSQDRKYLEDYNSKIIGIKEEERVLDEKKTELQAKRNAVETEQQELTLQKEMLKAQKTQRERLLVESKAREAELLAEYNRNRGQLDALDAAIIEYIGKFGDKAIDKGPVSAGNWIGNMGNTGLSSGAHLHFSIRDSYYGNPCEGNIQIFENGYMVMGGPSWLDGLYTLSWPYLYSGHTLSFPLAGPHVILTPQKKGNWHPFYHQGYAIDLTSYRSDRSVNVGAPVFAAMGGTLYKATDGHGGKYAYIRHTNGWTTCYLHLQ